MTHNLMSKFPRIRDLEKVASKKSLLLFMPILLLALAAVIPWLATGERLTKLPSRLN